MVNFRKCKITDNWHFIDNKVQMAKIAMAAHDNENRSKLEFSFNFTINHKTGI